MEFALMAPTLVMLLVAIMEFGTTLFVSTLMESGLREAARFGITGRTPEAGDRSSEIRRLLAEHTLGLVNMDNAVVDVRVYPDFASVGQGEAFVDGDGDGVYEAGETFTDSNMNGVHDADLGTPGPGGAGEVVLYRIRYDWPLMTPVARHVLGRDSLSLLANLAVRNEPWEGVTP